MRTYLVALVLVPLFHTGINPNSQQKSSPPAAAASQQQESLEEARADMEEGIKHLLVSQVEAWNHGKLENFMQGYWHSPDLTFFSGATVTKGWEPTLQRYRQRYQSEGKEMGKLEFQDSRSICSAAAPPSSPAAGS